MDFLRGLMIVMVGAGGLGVVLTREPLRQAILLSYYGLLWALLFFLLRAPDVALSQVVIGTLILPLLICFALAKTRQHATRARRQAGAQSGGSVSGSPGGRAGGKHG